MKKQIRFIVTFLGVYMEKSATGVETRKYLMVTRDHFNSNLQLANVWAEQNISKFLPKGITWITCLPSVVEDDFERRRQGIKVPRAKLKKWLIENYLKFRPLMNYGFSNGFPNDEVRLNKQSKFYLDLFEKECEIKADCVDEYHFVFWGRLQNQIIKFLRHQDMLVSHQAKRAESTLAVENSLLSEESRSAAN